MLVLFEYEKLDEDDKNDDEDDKNDDEDDNKDDDEEEINERCLICLCQHRVIVFVPCGYIPCCNDCAVLCDNCPVSRVLIDKRVKFYVPKVAFHNMNNSLKPK